jgi:hypothetical protein
MSEAAKRRSAHTSATPPPKSSRMSAAAPVFIPTVSKADDLDLDAESSANAAAVAAAVAKSRVTRPLPNSRRQAPGADFVPKQATVPKSVEQKENTRRLIVVLSQVSTIPSASVATLRTASGPFSASKWLALRIKELRHDQVDTI